MDMDACKQMLVNFYNLLFATTIWIQRPRLDPIFSCPVRQSMQQMFPERLDRNPPKKRIFVCKKTKSIINTFILQHT